ncbi:MAG: DEAD/DEAH box helicase [Planctomycetota bacterium]|jgi:ATP-dependent RNA helicase DeaD|nr:MAG: DEAD/DEAH box helicase [Planctomycetota bacterium]RLS47986.1 MAG: DEAD/DEAH box helicase [Planctomycetota bacterium]
MVSSETFDTTKTFADLGLPASVIKGVDAAGFKHPTKIQSALIPVAMSGKDVIGQAKTGTGKTAAFSLPVLGLLQPGDQFGALVLVPTRELAIQVCREVEELGGHTGIKAIPVYGGKPMRAQAQALESHPEIIVGTPGRVMDMHQRGLLPYNQFKVVILDEVDRMLDIGFREDIRKILGAMKQRPQTIFVSATISPEIEKLARSYMKSPEKIVTTEKSLTVSAVDQSWLTVEPWDKRKLLHHLLKHEEPALTIVFCRMKKTVDQVAEYLTKHGIDAHAMHGDMYQTKRDKVMDQLRGGSLGVLVASDLASRGLDVDDISHVINYDVPEDPEIYIHRIGRTARAGRHGVAWTFIQPDQGDLLSGIEMLANIEIPQKQYPDFTPGPIPADVSSYREAEKRRREESASAKSRMATAVAPTAAKAADPNAFPGGVVPSAMPMKRLGGVVRTRRG